MTNPIVFYTYSGRQLFVQFDDPDNLKLELTEGTNDRLRQYTVTAAELQQAELAEGKWSFSIREGNIEELTNEESILAVGLLRWDGEQEQDAQVSVVMDAGGGTLSARIGIVSITSQDYLEIVQGERKVITFIVEAHGRFVTASFGSIITKIKDAAGTVITKTEDDYSIERVCEELDVQVFRCTLDEDDTQELTAGLATIEISFDTQKARLTHSIKIIETLGTTGS